MSILNYFKKYNEYQKFKQESKKEELFNDKKFDITHLEERILLSADPLSASAVTILTADEFENADSTKDLTSVDNSIIDFSDTQITNNLIVNLDTTLTGENAITGEGVKEDTDIKLVNNGTIDISGDQIGTIEVNAYEQEANGILKIDLDKDSVKKLTNDLIKAQLLKLNGILELRYTDTTKERLVEGDKFLIFEGEILGDFFKIENIEINDSLVFSLEQNGKGLSLVVTSINTSDNLFEFSTSETNIPIAPSLIEEFVSGTVTVNEDKTVTINGILTLSDKITIEGKFVLSFEQAFIDIEMNPTGFDSSFKNLFSDLSFKNYDSFIIEDYLVNIINISSDDVSITISQDSVLDTTIENTSFNMSWLKSDKDSEQIQASSKAKLEASKADIDFHDFMIDSLKDYSFFTILATTADEDSDSDFTLNILDDKLQTILDDITLKMNQSSLSSNHYTRINNLRESIPSFKLNGDLSLSEFSYLNHSLKNLNPIINWNNGLTIDVNKNGLIDEDDSILINENDSTLIDEDDSILTDLTKPIYKEFIEDEHYNSDEIIRIEVAKATIEVDNAIKLSGKIFFEIGATHKVTINTGIGNAGLVADVLADKIPFLDTVQGHFEDALGINISDDYNTISGVEVESLIIGGSGLEVEVLSDSINDVLNLNFQKVDENTGEIATSDFALVVMKPTTLFIKDYLKNFTSLSIENSNTSISVKDDFISISQDKTKDSKSIINLNIGSSWKKDGSSSSGIGYAVIDFKSSFENGYKIKLSDSKDILLDKSNKTFEVYIPDLTVDIGKIPGSDVHLLSLEGDFYFSTITNKKYEINPGDLDILKSVLPDELFLDSLLISTYNASGTLKLDVGTELLNFEIKDVDMAVGIFTPNLAGLLKSGQEDKLPKFISIKLNITEALNTGELTNLIDLNLTNIVFSMNTMYIKGGSYALAAANMPSIDFTNNKIKLGLDEDSPVLDFNSEVISLSGNGKITLFKNISLTIDSENTTESFLLSKEAQTIKIGSDEKEVLAYKLVLNNADGFMGIEDENIGVELTDVSLNMLLMRHTGTFDQNLYTALIANIATAQIVGVPGITIKANAQLRLNKTFGPTSDYLDFSKNILKDKNGNFVSYPMPDINISDTETLSFQELNTEVFKLSFNDVTTEIKIDSFVLAKLEGSFVFEFNFDDNSHSLNLTNGQLITFFEGSATIFDQETISLSGILILNKKGLISQLTVTSNIAPIAGLNLDTNIVFEIKTTQIKDNLPTFSSSSFSEDFITNTTTFLEEQKNNEEKYIKIKAEGELNLLSILDLVGNFEFKTSYEDSGVNSTIKIIDASFEAVGLKPLSTNGTLTVGTDGIFGFLDISDSSITNIASITGSFALLINTASTRNISYTLKGETKDKNLEGRSLLLAADGKLSFLSDAINLSGEFDISIGSSKLDIIFNNISLEINDLLSFSVSGDLSLSTHIKGSISLNEEDDSGESIEKDILNLNSFLVLKGVAALSIDTQTLENNYVEGTFTIALGSFGKAEFKTKISLHEGISFQAQSGLDSSFSHISLSNTILAINYTSSTLELKLISDINLIIDSLKFIGDITFNADLLSIHIEKNISLSGIVSLDISGDINSNGTFNIEGNTNWGFKFSTPNFGNFALAARMSFKGDIELKISNIESNGIKISVDGKLSGGVKLPTPVINWEKECVGGKWGTPKVCGYYPVPGVENRWYDLSIDFDTTITVSTTKLCAKMDLVIKNPIKNISISATECWTKKVSSPIEPATYNATNRTLTLKNFVNEQDYSVIKYNNFLYVQSHNAVKKYDASTIDTIIINSDEEGGGIVEYVEMETRWINLGFISIPIYVEVIKTKDTSYDYKGTDNIYIGSGITQKIKIDAQKGDNNVVLLNAGDNSSVKTGNGNDTIEISGETNNITIDTGDGRNTVFINSDITSKITLNSGQDENNIYLNGASEDSIIQMGESKDNIYLQKSSKVRTINTAGGDDKIFIDKDVTQTLDIQAGVGSDLIYINGGAEDSEFYSELKNTSDSTATTDVDTIFVNGDFYKKIVAGRGHDLIYINGGSEGSSVEGGLGDDSFNIYHQTFEESLDFDEDTLEIASTEYKLANKISYFGNEGNDTFNGSFADEYIDMGEGNDKIYSACGTDTVIVDGLSSDSNIIQEFVEDDTCSTSPPDGTISHNNIIIKDGSSNNIVTGLGTNTITYDIYLNEQNITGNGVTNITLNNIRLDNTLSFNHIADTSKQLSFNTFLLKLHNQINLINVNETSSTLETINIDFNDQWQSTDINFKTASNLNVKTTNFSSSGSLLSFQANTIFDTTEGFQNYDFLLFHNTHNNTLDIKTTNYILIDTSETIDDPFANETYISDNLNTFQAGATQFKSDLNNYDNINFYAANLLFASELLLLSPEKVVINTESLQSNELKYSLITNNLTINSNSIGDNFKIIKFKEIDGISEAITTYINNYFHINVNHLTITKSATALNLSEEDDITLEGTFHSMSDINIVAGGNITVNTQLEASNTIDIEAIAAASSIIVNENIKAKDITITAGKDVTINKDLTADDSLTIKSNDTINLNSVSTITASNLLLDTTTGNINLNASNLLINEDINLNANTDIIMSAGGNIESTLGDISLTSTTGNIETEELITNALNKSITISAENGEITNLNSNSLITTTNLILFSSKDIGQSTNKLNIKVDILDADSKAGSIYIENKKDSLLTIKKLHALGEIELITPKKLIDTDEVAVSIKAVKVSLTTSQLGEVSNLLDVNVETLNLTQQTSGIYLKEEDIITLEGIFDSSSDINIITGGNISVNTELQANSSINIDSKGSIALPTDYEFGENSLFKTNHLILNSDSSIGSADKFFTLEVEKITATAKDSIFVQSDLDLTVEKLQAKETIYIKTKDLLDGRVIEVGEEIHETITAKTLKIDSSSIASEDNFMNINVETIELINKDMNSIYINEKDSIILEGFFNSSNKIELNANGSIYLNTSLKSQNSISLNTNDSLVLDSKAGIIETSSLNINAKNSIALSTNRLITTIDKLESTSGLGGIHLENSKAITLNAITSLGDVYIKADDIVQKGNIISKNLVVLNSEKNVSTGYIQADTVTLRSGKNGYIYDNALSLVNIKANSLNLIGYGVSLSGKIGGSDYLNAVDKAIDTDVSKIYVGTYSDRNLKVDVYTSLTGILFDDDNRSILFDNSKILTQSKTEMGSTLGLELTLKSVSFFFHSRSQAINESTKHAEDNNPFEIFKTDDLLNQDSKNNSTYETVNPFKNNLLFRPNMMPSFGMNNTEFNPFNLEQEDLLFDYWIDDII